MNWKHYLQAFMIVLIIFLLFLARVSLHLIIIVAVFMILLIIFKTKLYKKLDKVIRQKLKFSPSFPDWIIKLVITAIFLLLYMLIKQIVFMIMKHFGLDIQEIMFEGINNTVIGQH